MAVVVPAPAIDLEVLASVAALELVQILLDQAPEAPVQAPDMVQARGTAQVQVSTLINALLQGVRLPQASQHLPPQERPHMKLVAGADTPLALPPLQVSPQEDTPPQVHQAWEVLPLQISPQVDIPQKARELRLLAWWASFPAPREQAPQREQCQ